MRATIVTTMRNEGPFILEWLAYHRLIGFTDFVVYSNDCDDGTDQLLDRLQDMGLLHHHDNPRSNKKTVQWKALGRADRHPAVKAADWVMCADVDEFLNIHAGQGHLQDLFAACPDADCFSIAWRMFGHNGHARYQDGLVIEDFTHAAPETMVWPWRCVQYKTLFRNDGHFEKLGVHRPKGDARLDKARRWVDGSGQPFAVNAGTVTVKQGPRYDLAQLNHYALGSAENYLVKADRGKPNRSSDPIDLAYWVERNFNTVQDTSILRHRDAVRVQVDDWKQDATLRELHDQSVTWRKDRIAALLLEKEPYYLYTHLLQTPDTAVLSEAEQNRLMKNLFAMLNAERQRGNDP